MMSKPKIVVFSGPSSTIANSPTLVTSNKGRLPGEPRVPGRYDHLVPQLLYEPVKVKIRKYSAHPLEEDAKEVYHDGGLDYYEVELRPDDGPYPLPYMARRANGSKTGTPFEETDLMDPDLRYGGRQFFYPDASRLFEEVDRTIAGRGEGGDGNFLNRMADFDFVRALPPGGYMKRGEVAGIDYFAYRPNPLARRPTRGSLARLTNIVRRTIESGDYAGGIWFEGSPTVEETTYWLSLVIGTDLPLVGCAAQRPHGSLANDGDRNIVDAVSYIVSGKGNGLGAVGVIDQQIFAAREFKKGDARPGGYKATGGHGGVLGTVGPPVTVWYVPAYKRGATSELSVGRISDHMEGVQIKDVQGNLLPAAIPRVHMVKYGQYMSENIKGADNEVDILARIEQGLVDERSNDPEVPKLHGFVFEGSNSYAGSTESQVAALSIAVFSGMPVVKVSRADPGGRVVTGRPGLMIEGSNLDPNKARILMMAAMLKVGRLPRARDPRNPSAEERKRALNKLAEYQEIFETH
jgi:L-asparaginase